MDLDSSVLKIMKRQPRCVDTPQYLAGIWGEQTAIFFMPVVITRNTKEAKVNSLQDRPYVIGIRSFSHCFLASCYSCKLLHV